MALEIYSREARYLIDQAVRRVLASSAPQFGRNSVASSGMMYVAQTDVSGLTGRSGTGPGSGTVTLQKVDNGALTAQQDEDGNDITVTAYNLSTETLPGSSYTFLVQDVLGGTLWAVWEDCPV